MATKKVVEDGALSLDRDRLEYLNEVLTWLEDSGVVYHSDLGFDDVVIKDGKGNVFCTLVKGKDNTWKVEFE